MPKINADILARMQEESRSRYIGLAVKKEKPKPVKNINHEKRLAEHKKRIAEIQAQAKAARRRRELVKGFLEAFGGLDIEFENCRRTRKPQAVIKQLDFTKIAAAAKRL